MRESADGFNVACTCPNVSCESRRKGKLKLAVHLVDGRYHCWVCGVKGSSVAFLVGRHRQELVGEAEKFWRVARRRPTLDVPAHVAVQVPPGFMLMAANLDTRVPELRAVVEYVLGRGLTVDDMWRRRLGFSTEGNFVGRVIAPSFDRDGHLNYYTARSIRDDIYPKYYNAPTRKQAIVYNELDVDWSSELVVTEGPFDLFKTVGNATCLLGSTLAEDFLLFHRVVENGTPVVLALDAGEDVKTDRIARLLYSYDVDVSVMSVDGYRDLGEMPRGEFVRRLKSARVWSPSTRLLDRIAALDVGCYQPLSGTTS